MAKDILRMTRFSIEHSSDGIFWMTSDARIVDVNEAACRSFGYSREELLQLSIPDIDPFYNADVWRQFFVDLRQHGTLTFETVHSTKDGKRFPVEIVANYIQFDSEELSCAFVRNITERKRAEEEKLALEQQLLHIQKMESLGVLAGGIAHDFNNILAIIIGYCGLTKMDYKNAEVNIIEIEKAAERAAGLCRQMLAYAGKAQLTKTQINMNMLVNEMVSMMKSTLPLNAFIKLDLSTRIPTISGDASQLRQIVMNLVINASEAIGKVQGEIRVSLANTRVTAGQADKDYHGKSIPPGDYVCLEVTDNGCGMDDETKWRIFEPFYTTKFTGRGLGLSAVLGIINSHGGALRLFSQQCQGTTFKVYLPVQISDSVGDENISPVTPTAPWQGSGTILLVEDDDQVRLIANMLLQKFGFTVLEAINGKEALELYQNNTADISLVVTDMGMPVMDGYELFRELKQLKPELPIIVTSGFGDAEISSRIVADDIAGIISKPYNPDQLREVLKNVLEGLAPTQS
jgi:PAS domain S-box-containing protein